MKTSMRTAVAALSAAALTAATAACTSPGDGRGASPAAEPADLGNVRLVAYSSCDDMLAKLRDRTAANAGPYGLGPEVSIQSMDAPAMARDAQALKAAPESGSGAPEHSTTNVQEAGVDEPDLVKTDGKRIVTVTRGTLRVVDAESRKVTARLELAEDQGYAPADLLVSGDRALVVFAHGGFVALSGAAGGTAGGATGGTAGDAAKRAFPVEAHYILVDLSGAPKVLGSLTPKGSHVDARMIGSTVRLVVRSRPQFTFPRPRPGLTPSELIKLNQDVVRKAPIDTWLPSYEVTDAAGARRTATVKCESVAHPEDYTGTSLLSVHTIDLAAGVSGVEPIAVAADGDTVYGTATSLYVASNPRWWFPPMPIDPVPLPRPVERDPAQPSTLPEPTGSGVAPDVAPTPAEPLLPRASTPSAAASFPEPPAEETEIHRFDIGGAGAPRYIASGAVAGRLLNQYSLSEHDGHLRVATTINQETPSGPPSSSSVYVLKSDTLAKVGEVTGLGKDERIYAVRFIGPVGYVVTFKQVDPLYTLDLRDPAAPRVTGELKITGYSAYLHPAGEGWLIGVGQEASTRGRTLGTQISLFDVGDPARPTRLSQYFQKESGSEAEWDPHAFLYWPKEGLAVLPLSSWQQGGLMKSGALGLRIEPTKITKVGLVQHEAKRPAGDGAADNVADNVYLDPAIRRSLVIGDTLWTVSDLGMKASDLRTFADRAWIPFD